MKVIIQIPCYNEAESLSKTVKDLPSSIPGVDIIEVLVVDDGSTDRTVEVAQDSGVDHILSLGSNRGLATAFSMGLQHAVRLGADVVVNTDGDNQYCGQDIEKLVTPILANRADIVVGTRLIDSTVGFSPLKKFLLRLGTSTVRWISQTRVQDAASGFRAFSADACLKLFIHSKFSYCMESLIQAGNTGLRVRSVDTRVNPVSRPSRLFRSMPQYLYRSGATILSMFLLYRPGLFFSLLAVAAETTALALGLRFVYLIYLTPTPEPERTYIPSLILFAVCALTGVLLLFFGLLGENLRRQRRLTEESVYLLRKVTAIDK